MTRLIIIEDEPSALRRLKRLVMEIRPEWQIIATADNVAKGIEIVKKEDFDLILSDIQLSDGLSFEVLTTSKVKTPVIFITAYDEFAIKAFEFNSIHYLLKPIKPEHLHAAFEKFERNEMNSFDKQAALFTSEKSYQQKLLSKVGNHTLIIEITDIALFFHKDRLTVAILFNGKKHLIDNSLDKLQELLSEDQFFRINRQAIVRKESVKKTTIYSSSRLLLSTDPEFDEELIVSKEKTPQFKKWLQKKT